MSRRFEKRAVLVTGGSTGIGRACALRFGSEGASVAIDYCGDPGPAKSVVDEVVKAGGRAVMVEGDVTKEADVDAIVERTVAEFGSLDVLVNNAGIEHEAPLVETPLSLWDRVIEVDLRGPWICTQRAAKQMIAQRGGRIINISSVHEDLPMPENTPYCAAKGGLRMLMRTVCLELAEYGITVNNIAPGAIDTPMDAATKRDPAKMQRLLAEIPLRRMGRAEEVAALCAWLASSEAAYVTGATYVIDGGLMRHATNL